MTQADEQLAISRQQLAQFNSASESGPLCSLVDFFPIRLEIAQKQMRLKASGKNT